MKLVRRILISTVILVGGAASANANTITPDFVSVVDQLNGTFLWTYSASLSNGRLDADFDAAQFFTIYDIAGYVDDSAEAASADWTASDPFLGVTPPSQVASVTDAAPIANVSFEYTSSTTLCSGQETPNSGPCFFNPPNHTIPLGTFSFLSIYGGITDGDWASQDIARNSTIPQGASGRIEVPFQPTTTVPDGGSTMALMGLAMLAVGTLRNRFRG